MENLPRPIVVAILDAESFKEETAGAIPVDLQGTANLIVGAVDEQIEHTVCGNTRSINLNI